MPTKAVYLLAVPGFADWEPAHALAELRRHGQYRVEVVGLTSDPVESMGGVLLLPSRTVAALEPDDIAVFIVPGGDRWEREPLQPELVGLLRSLDSRGVPIAAICAGTTALARAGVIRGRRHTSNGLAYLKKQVPEYQDEATYVAAPAVRDRGLITASGLADVEFAAELMAELGVLNDASRGLWAKMFRSGRVPDRGSLQEASWPHPDSLDAIAAAPAFHKVLLENERVRVLDTRIPPGQATPVHTHRWTSALYVLSWSAFVRQDEKGEVILDSRAANLIATPGSAIWSGPLPPHSLRNVGESDLHVLSVELKS